MTVRRRRRPGSDRLQVFSPEGLPLGHLDLITRTVHDVPTRYTATFREEVDRWLVAHGRPPLQGASGDQGGDDAGASPALETGIVTPPEGWAADDAWSGPSRGSWPGRSAGSWPGPSAGSWPGPSAGSRNGSWPGDDDSRTGATPVAAPEDLAAHLPGHGLAAEASRARADGVPAADRAYRLRLDGRHAVADALGKLTGRGPGRRRPHWRVLHGITMPFDDGPVLIDHLLVGPAGIFVIEVANHPGGRVVVGPRSLEIDRERLDLERRRLVGEEVEDRIAEALAIAAGAERTLNPPPVYPVIAVVGAVLVGRERPPGVLVARVGQLPRLLQAFGTPLTDVAVAQIYNVARQAVTWTR